MVELTFLEVEEPRYLYVRCEAFDAKRMHLQSCSHHWRWEEIHLVEEVVAALRPEVPVEQRLEPLAAARLVAGNTDNKQRSFDTHRTQHMDLGRHNIEHIVH